MTITIKKETLAFLKDLKRNNDREWFGENKDRYLSAHENMVEFVQGLIYEMAPFDKSLAGLEAKKAVYRIYRDIRFSNDKSPYKPNFGAFMVNKKNSFNQAGCYLHVEPGGCFLAGGIYMPDSATLRAIRKEISGDAKGFLKIVKDKNFKANFTIVGNQLSRVPQGFSKEDPMAEYLKYKELSLIHSLSDKDVISESFMSHCVKVFKGMLPFNEFINAAIAGNQ